MCTVFLPLPLWTWKKEESYNTSRQGREVLNFQITIALLMVVLSLLFIVLPATLLMAQGLDREGDTLGNLFTLIPPLPLVLLALFACYQAVVNTIRALSGQPTHYPLSLPFVR